MAAMKLPAGIIELDERDTSARPVLMSEYLLSWWEGCVYDFGFRPLIAQGSWMSLLGGGAGASQGYHDKGGAIDVSVRGLTRAQIDTVVLVTRQHAGDSWERAPWLPGGFVQHIHVGIHTDTPVDNGITFQHVELLANRNGLVPPSQGPDYGPRLHPFPTAPTKEQLMPTADEIAAAVAPAVWAETLKAVNGDPIKAGAMLAQTHNRAGKPARVDEAAIAAAVVKALPAGQPVDQSTIEAALRDVLGSLNDA